MSFLFQKNISKPPSSESVFAKPLIQNPSSYLYDHQTDENVQNKSIENNSGFSFQNIPIQPKLKVSQPADLYEKEADRISDQIVQMPNDSNKGNISRQVDEEEEFLQLKLSDDVISRKCTSCEMKDAEDEDLKISRKSSGTGNLQVSDNFSNQIHTSMGKPLDESTKSFM